MEEDSSSSFKEEGEGGKGIIVILVGAPGSGKSTFCEDVIKIAHRSWVRICQDSIANGKAGTKLQCLKSASDALKDGKNVFIDRCNLDREQRADFVKLGGPKVDVHAVVLDLPARLCISRSVKRTGHEGNLQGGKAAAVVNRMLQSKEFPKLSEGYTRITFCQNETDVKGAVKMYSALDPHHNLPSGCFGQKNSDTKVQLGIMKFLKKVDCPDNKNSGSMKIADSKSQKHIQKDCLSLDTENHSTVVRNEDKNIMVGRDVIGQPADSGSIMDGCCTLAFPSISTSDFQFNHDKASDIVVEKVDQFLNKVEDVRLIFVDLTNSHMLSLVKKKAALKNIDPVRFSIVVGDITQLYTKAGLCCNIIANAANWRLKPGGGGVNAAIFNAAGHALEIATKERAETLSPGNSVAVPLPPTSPLYEREGVTHVIHVLGPNMNPQRPNCLKNDYDKGCKVLREAYSSLFETFASIVRKSNQKESTLNSKSSDAHVATNNDESSSGDHRLKRGNCSESERNKKYKGLSLECGQSTNASNFTEQKDIEERVKKVWPSWAQALHHIAMHPKQDMDGVLEISDDIVVLHDLYPKAKKHLLVLSRLDGLDQLKDIREEHLSLLRSMHSVGLRWVEKLSSDDASLVFRLGYHLVPSMRQLHLHVISQDFDSPNLKNKKHWNSFNTAFFRDSADVIQEIEKFSKATVSVDEKILSMELRCHRCRSAHPNIPRLKAHINNCRAKFPALLLQNGCLICKSPAKDTVGE